MQFRVLAAGTAAFIACAFGAQATELRLVTIGGAITETICALGLGSQLVGVDSSSLYPDAVTKLPQIGYERTLSAEGVLSLNPSLIIATSDAGPPEVIDQIRRAGVKIVIVKAEPGVRGAKRKIQETADAVGKSSEGDDLNARIDAQIERLPAAKTLESGIFLLLPPGAFTGILAGKNGGTGVGLRRDLSRAVILLYTTKEICSDFAAIRPVPETSRPEMPRAFL